MSLIGAAWGVASTLKAQALPQPVSPPVSPLAPFPLPDGSSLMVLWFLFKRLEWGIDGLATEIAAPIIEKERQNHPIVFPWREEESIRKWQADQNLRLYLGPYYKDAAETFLKKAGLDPESRRLTEEEFFLYQQQLQLTFPELPAILIANLLLSRFGTPVRKTGLSVSAGPANGKEAPAPLQVRVPVDETGEVRNVSPVVHIKGMKPFEPAGVALTVHFPLNGSPDAIAIAEQVSPVLWHGFKTAHIVIEAEGDQGLLEVQAQGLVTDLARLLEEMPAQVTEIEYCQRGLTIHYMNGDITTTVGSFFEPTVTNAVVLRLETKSRPGEPLVLKCAIPANQLSPVDSSFFLAHALQMALHQAPDLHELIVDFSLSHNVHLTHPLAQTWPLVEGISPDILAEGQRVRLTLQIDADTAVTYILKRSGGKLYKTYVRGVDDLWKIVEVRGDPDSPYDVLVHPGKMRSGATRLEFFIDPEVEQLAKKSVHQVLREIVPLFKDWAAMGELVFVVPMPRTGPELLVETVREWTRGALREMNYEGPVVFQVVGDGVMHQIELERRAGHLGVVAKGVIHSVRQPPLLHQPSVRLGLAERGAEIPAPPVPTTPPGPKAVPLRSLRTAARPSPTPRRDALVDFLTRPVRLPRRPNGR